MPDSTVRYPHRNTQTRVRSGSETIQRRVAQLMECSNVNIVSAGEGFMARSRDRSRRRNCPGHGSDERSKNQELENKPIPLEPSALRAQKKKDVSEITMASTITRSQPAPSVTDTLVHTSDQIYFHEISHKNGGTHSPQYPHIHIDHSGSRFEGKPAEHASLRKEIDALKNALHEYKLATQQQFKVCGLDTYRTYVCLNRISS